MKTTDKILPILIIALAIVVEIFLLGTTHDVLVICWHDLTRYDSPVWAAALLSLVGAIMLFAVAIAILFGIFKMFKITTTPEEE